MFISLHLTAFDATGSQQETKGRGWKQMDSQGFLSMCLCLLIICSERVKVEVLMDVTIHIYRLFIFGLTGFS